ncbi:major facilitator superfamily MFS_1 (plasmid) [Rhodovulum sulfidophilum]|uniref:Major facilitator superfamily MFS_1 n=1 Tax=Rhodovulum sulfidophilum TaxID=35806 RepID=A0A0D6B9R4_RHOSU|nr:hypothetical protein [Rhodovulum sulfidophilum]MBL3565846.1 hypothetical protein [Rhodovulum sulfidophilum]BAQ71570.1 major facilitator superfamily MFS_1 [Rhodovulum sulfidophilum]
MKFFGMAAFGASALLLAVFAINLIGARAGAALIGTAAETVLLFLAAACFGLGTLSCEARRDACGADGPEVSRRS